MNKQHFILSIVLAAMAMLAAGCQKEEGTVTLGAEIQKPSNSKVYIVDHMPCWHNGDEVYINAAAYPVMAASGASARIEDVVSADAYRAIFPASIVSAGSDISNSSSIPITLPPTQQYQLVGNHQRVDVPMGAYLTSGSTLQFYNLCSIVRVTVSNSLNQDLSLNRLELRTQTAGLSGQGTATLNGTASDCITMSSSASHTVALRFSNNAITVGALASETFDIVVPAFSNDNVAITAYTTDGQYSEETKTNVSLAHNTITTVTLNVTDLTETVGAELVDGPTFNSTIPSNATAVVFEYNSSVSTGTLLSTPNSPVPIYGNMDGTTWKVSTSARMINANPNSSSMFRGTYSELAYGGFNSTLREIDLGNGFNTTNVVRMDSMFCGCKLLENLDVSNFNTQNVTNMSCLFYSCMRLTNLDVANFNTQNDTSMSRMFGGCESLTSLCVTHFNTENVTNISFMFSGCRRLTSLDVSNINTENVTNMQGLFNSCRNITSLDVSNFNTENVTNMGNLFSWCENLEYLSLSNFNTSNVTNMNNMFAGCESLTSLDLSNFNTENVTRMDGMFEGCYSLINLNISNFNTARVTNMLDMFRFCSSLTALSLSNFNTYNVSNMTYMFQGCSNLSSLDLSSFYTPRLVDMEYMFGGCRNLTNLDLSHFDMSRVRSRGGMLENLATTSQYCTITCTEAVQTIIQSMVPSGVTITWVRPTSK